MTDDIPDQKPDLTQADLAWRAKGIIRKAVETSDLRDQDWRKYQQSDQLSELLKLTGYICTEVGLTKCPWDKVPLQDQCAIARTLMSSPQRNIAFDNIKNVHARCTHNKSIDTYLDITNLEKAFTTYPFTKEEREFMQAFSKEMLWDHIPLERARSNYPVNPDDITLKAVAHIRQHSQLTDEELAILEIYAMDRELKNPLPTKPLTFIQKAETPTKPMQDRKPNDIQKGDIHGF